MTCALCGAARSASAVLLCGACAASVATGQDHTGPCACEHCKRCDGAEDARDRTYDGTRDRVYVFDLPEVVEATARLQREATARLTRERDEARADAARAREAYAIDLAGLRDTLRRADDLRVMWRERVADVASERDALRADLAATRAALRANLRCDECDELATRCHADTARFGCDAHGVGEGWADTTHAAVVREALR